MGFRRFTYVIGIIILFLLAIYFNTPAGFAILAAGILLIPVSGIFSLPLRHRVKVTLEVAEVKEKSLVVRVHAENKSIFPVSLLKGTLYTRNTLTGEEKGLPLSFTINGHGAENCSCAIKVANCGKYRCSIRNMGCYDMLSFFHFRLEDTEEAFALILPDMFPVEVAVRMNAANEDVPEYEMTTKGSDLTEVFGLKEYQPGDKLHAIHWKASSKFDTLVVKEGSKSMEQSVYLIWNPGKNALSPEEKNALAEVYVSVACNLIEQKVPLYLGFYEENLGWQEEEVHVEEDLLAVLGRILENEPKENSLPVTNRHMVIVTAENQEAEGDMPQNMAQGILPIRTFLLLLPKENQEAGQILFGRVDRIQKSGQISFGGVDRIQKSEQLASEGTDRIYGFHVEEKEQELWQVEI